MECYASTSTGFKMMRPSGELFSAKRAGIQKAKSKILKNFSNPLTLYFATTYLFFCTLSAARCTLFFDQTRSFAPL
jgi:hypothetical protein